MNLTHHTAQDQAAVWNSSAGHAWVDAQELLDQLFQPFEEILVQAVSAAPGARVLDVGCGTGSTTLAAARLLGTGGSCTGIDISDPMITAARARAERANATVTFIRADAQSHPFDTAGFDIIISRFGVMFFDDPVRAFANLRRAAAASGSLRFIAWRSAVENPFMTTAERAAAPLLPDLPPRRPDGPGQFAFASPQRIRTILEDSGWTQIDIQPIDVDCSLPRTELVRYVARLGPVGLFLQAADEATRRRVVEAVLPAFEPYIHEADVRFTAACWAVSARA